jgi:hypothetical protein
MRIVKLSLEKLNHNEVIRQAGGGEYASDTTIQNTIDKAIKKAVSLIDGQGIYQEFPAVAKEEGIFITSEPQSPPFHLPFPGYSRMVGVEEVTIFVVTIGGKLEEQVAEAFQRKEALEGLFLDAAGSVAVEEVADKLNTIIAKDASNKGLKSSYRFSPGYCNWKMDLQRWVFQVLDTSGIGVLLAESLLMVPQKTISGIIFQGKDLEPLNPCVGCKKEDCRDRR